MDSAFVPDWILGTRYPAGWEAIPDDTGIEKNNCTKNRDLISIMQGGERQHNCACM